MKLDDRKQRWQDFYAGKRRTLVLIEMDYGPRVYPAEDNEEAFFDYVMRKYRVQADCLEWLDDDRVPCISAAMGTDNFAHAFGSPVVYPGNNNPYARPAVFSAAEAAKIKKPKLEDSSLMEIIEYSLKLQKAAPGMPIQLPDIQSPLDIAALIWDKTDFFMALYDEPRAVKEIIEMVTALQIEFLDLWFDTFGKEFIAHYPDYYMPLGITVSEDEIGSISTGQFIEFSVPQLCKLSSHFGGVIGIHCCANAKHQWEQLKAIPGLVMLNLVQPDAVIKEASAYFRDGPGQMFGFTQNYCTDPAAKVILQGTARSKQEALALLEELRNRR